VIIRNAALAEGAASPIGSPRWRHSSLVALTLGALIGASPMPARAQDDKLPVKQPPVPGGVIPMPEGYPTTAQQAPVPPPVHSLPPAEKPLKVSPATETAGKAITLQQAVAIALYTSKDFAAAVANLQQAQGRRGQAAAMLNPTVGANAQITEFDAPTTANLSAFSGGGASNAPPFVIIPQFNPAFTASVALPLDIAGTLHSAVSQAQFQEVAARIDVNRVRNNTVYNVKSAFYNVLRAQAQIAVAVEAQNNALGRLNDANKRYAAGTAPRFDVITAQRDVADAQQGVINARAQLSVNLAALKNTMGVDIKARIKVVDSDAVVYPTGVEPPKVLPAPAPNPTAPIETPEPKPIGPPGDTSVPGATPIPSTNEADDNFDFGPDFDALLKDALNTRPEVLEADAQIAAAKRGIQYARRSSLPSLSLGLSDTYTPNAAGFTRRNEAAVTLGVNLPIFDGGLARERVREARGVVANAEVSKRREVDQVQVDLQQAYIALVQARNRVAVANVGLTQAREAFRLAGVRYTAGVSQQTGISPQLELSNAQTSLTQAQSNQVNALYDYNNARAQLDRAVGRYSFTGSSPGYSSPPPPSVRGSTVK